MYVAKQFLIHLCVFFFFVCVTWLESGPGPPSCRIFAIILRQTLLGRTYSELLISSSQRPVPDNTQHSQETYLHAPGGIRTRNPNK